MTIKTTKFYSSIFYVLLTFFMVGLIACGSDKKPATKGKAAVNKERKGKSAAKTSTSKEKVYTLKEVDVKPIFGKNCPKAKNPVGCSRRSIETFIKSNVKFPASAIKNNQKGKEKVTFVLKKDGKMGNVKFVSTVNGNCADCKKAAVDAVAKMKDWKPGMKDGKPVDVRMVLPIVFDTK